MDWSEVFPSSAITAEVACPKEPPGQGSRIGHSCHRHHLSETLRLSVRMDAAEVLNVMFAVCEFAWLEARSPPIRQRPSLAIPFWGGLE